MNNKLAAKIIARNRVNTLANILLPEIVKVLVPFVGQKVALKTGGMSDKLDKALLRFRESGSGNVVWFDCRYGLEACFKTCQSTDAGGCVYAEQAVTLGGIKQTREGGILESVNTRWHFRTDYTVQEIEIVRKSVEIAREALRAAEWKLIGFGEHDNG